MVGRLNSRHDIASPSSLSCPQYNIAFHPRAPVRCLSSTCTRGDVTPSVGNRSGRSRRASRSRGSDCDCDCALPPHVERSEVHGAHRGSMSHFFHDGPAPSAHPECTSARHTWIREFEQGAAWQESGPTKHTHRGTSTSTTDSTGTLTIPFPCVVQRTVPGATRVTARPSDAWEKVRWARSERDMPGVTCGRNSSCQQRCTYMRISATSYHCLLSDFVFSDPRLHLRFFWNESEQFCAGVVHWQMNCEGPPGQRGQRRRRSE